MSQSGPEPGVMTQRLDLREDQPRRLNPLFERALSIGVTEDDSIETMHIKRLVTGALWVSLIFPWAAIAQLMLGGAPLAALAIGCSFLSSAIALTAIWLRPALFQGVFHFVVGSSLAVSVTMTLLFGGVLASGINYVWAIVLVVGAAAVFGDGRAVVWDIRGARLRVTS